MVEESERVLGGWRDGARLDLHAELMSLTLAIVARTLFGSDVSRDAARIGAAIETLMRAYLGIAKTGILVPSFLPTPGNLRARRAVDELDAIVTRLVRARRKSGDDPGDLLSMLLASDEDGASMSDLQLRDECITLLLAGHETTALALTFTFYLLSRSPDVEARLQRELDEVLAGRPAGFADLRQLRFTDAVVREAMRLYPPAWAIGRESLTDPELGSFYLPRGAQVIMSQWVVHRSAEHFPEPESFRPERWLDERDEGLPRFAYFPFGGGARVCIGNAFAMLEAVLVLATIAQRYRFRADERGPLRLLPSVTVRPEHGLQGTLERRAPRRAAPRRGRAPLKNGARGSASPATTVERRRPAGPDEHGADSSNDHGAPASRRPRRARRGADSVHEAAAGRSVLHRGGAAHRLVGWLSSARSARPFAEWRRLRLAGGGARHKHRPRRWPSRRSRSRRASASSARPEGPW
jgi:cytochrome P450